VGRGVDIDSIPCARPSCHATLKVMDVFTSKFPSTVFHEISADIDAGTTNNILHLVFLVLLEPECVLA